MKKVFTFILFVLTSCMFVSCVEKLLPGESYLILEVDNQSGDDVYCWVFSKKKENVRMRFETDVTEPIKIPSSKSKEIICFYDMAGGDNDRKNWKWAFEDADTVYVVFDRVADRINDWRMVQNDQQVDRIMRFTIDDVPQSKTFSVVYDGNKSEQK